MTTTNVFDIDNPTAIHLFAAQEGITNPQGKSIAYRILEAEHDFILVGPVAGSLPPPESPTLIKMMDYGICFAKKKFIYAKKSTEAPLSQEANVPTIRRTTSFPRCVDRVEGADVPVAALLLRRSAADAIAERSEREIVMSGGSVQMGRNREQCDLWFALTQYDVANQSLVSDFGTDFAGHFDGKGMVYTKVDPRGVNDEIFDLQKDGQNYFIAIGFTNPGRVHGVEPSFNFGLVRYKQNGERDLSFGMNGIVITEIMKADTRPSSLLVHPMGSYYTAGGRLRWPSVSDNFHFVFARYDRSGNLDSSFGGESTHPSSCWPNLSRQRGVVIHKFEESAYCVKMLPVASHEEGGGNGWFAGGRAGSNKSIFVPPSALSQQHYKFILVKYTEAGHVDTTFGNKGVVRISFGNNPGIVTNDIMFGMLRHQNCIYMLGSSAELDSTSRKFLLPQPAIACICASTGHVYFNKRIKLDGVATGSLYDGLVTQDERTLILVGTSTSSESQNEASQSSKFLCVTFSLLNH